MKPNQPLATCGILLKQTLQIIQSFSAPLRLLLALVFCAASASADTLIWDAGNTNNGPTIDPASGAWDTDTTTNLNWNNGSSNVSWTQTSVTAGLNGATFNGPDAAAGTYQVVVDDVGQVAATNITINANGYVFSGSPLYLNRPGNAQAFVIADGKNVVISNNLAGGGSPEFLLGGNGAPSSVTFCGNLQGGYTPTFSSTDGSIVYLAGTNGSSVGNILTDLRQTNGTYNSGSAFVIGRNGGSLSQPSNATGSFTVDGPTTVLNQSSDYIYLGRNLGNGNSPWNATLTIQNGGTVNYQINGNNNNLGLTLPRNGGSGANCISRVFMYGGTLNMGPGTETSGAGGGPNPRPIFLMDGGSLPGQVATLTQTGGVINAWSGIIIGGAGATRTGGSAMITNSGGFLYIGAIGNNGIKYGANIPPTNNISLSGGTVGALGNWISSVPMTLATLNGNITFQCADSNSTPFNISLSGALTGPGGFNKSGGGVLTLTGTNNYAGATVVSNGTLVISTANFPKSGDLVLDGSGASSGLPLLSNSVPSAGQTWTMTNLTVAAGTPTIDFQFGSLPPSTTVAPIQANGNVTLTVTPNFAVDGSVIPTGTYPLIQYTGAYSGPSSMSLVYLPPGGISGYVTNIVATKTITLVINSSLTAPLTWGVGNGAWDIATSPNWRKFGVATTYHEGDSVQFDDSASGTSPIAVTLNTTVNPANVIASSVNKSYIISGPIPGPGAISGPASVTVSSGTLTLSNANTYTGGTTVTGPGQLNINYGGTGGADSAIGTGALSLNTAAKIDNTSGHSIVLNTAIPIPVNWVDDWTFVGSANLDLGLGQVTLGNSEVKLTVITNTLTVNNSITDNGLNFKLTKLGNGTLTLSNANSSFGGGLDLNAGTLNINSDGSVGSGDLSLNGGVLDNTSGAEVRLATPHNVNMLANFTFNGTTNLILAPQGGAGTFSIGGNTITVNGTGTLTTEGAFLGGNRTTTVNGTGKLIFGGDGANQNLNLIINGGTVYLNKNSGAAQNNPITINTNGSLVILNPSTTQIGNAPSVTLGGGLMDLNGDTESIGSLAFNAGILRNSAPSTASALNVTGAVTLGSASCVFDVPAVDSSLTLSSATGSGGLIVTGLGTVNLTTNGYTGDTSISNGVLVLSFPTLGTNSTVTVSTNATLGTNGVLTLNFANSETNTVGALILGGVSKPPGLYSATTDPRYIAGLGSLLVVPVSSINPIGGPILFTNLGSGTLGLSWPTNLGWILQTQTNQGIDPSSNAWFDVSGSSNITATNIAIAPTNNAYFRLRHP